MSASVGKRLKLPGSTYIKAIAIAVALAIITAVSRMWGSYPTLIAMAIMIFYIYSLSWSLLANTGMVSLGQALFFALGAYAYGIFVLSYGVNPWLALFAGPAVGALAGLAVGFVSSKLRDWYIGIFTFALTPAGYALAVSSQLSPWTAGAVGLTLPAFPLSLGARLALSSALAFAAYLVILLIKNRRIGFALSAINDDETAAGTIGINSRLYKTMAIRHLGLHGGARGGDVRRAIHELRGARLLRVSRPGIQRLASLLLHDRRDGVPGGGPGRHRVPLPAAELDQVLAELDLGRGRQPGARDIRPPPDRRPPEGTEGDIWLCG